MPASKNGYKRIRIIDNMIRRSFYPTKEEILDKLREEGYAISGATFENDLNTMRNSMNLNICFDRMQRGYYYDDEEARLDVALTNDEIELVWMVLKKQNLLQQSVFYRNVLSSLQRLMKRMDIDLDEKSNRLEGIFDMDLPTKISEIPYGSLIFDAIWDKRMITFFIEKKGIQESHQLNPYNLKQSNGHWFVEGLENGLKEAYKLVSLLDLRVTNQHFLVEESYYTNS